MKRRALLLLSALAIALVGTFLVFSYADKSGAEAAPEEQAPVLVATQLIAAGTTGQQMLDQGLVQLTELPVRAVAAGALSDLVPVTELALNGDVQPGEVLFQANFGEPRQLAGLQIPDDKMAISVRLEDPQRVAGFVEPGAEIAVFNTYVVDGPGTPAENGAAPPKVEKATRLLLPRATVIAAGSEALDAVKPVAAEATGETATPEDRTTIVTLAVTVEEAQKLAHAAHTGELYLGLLSERSRTQSGPPVDNRTLFN